MYFPDRPIYMYFVFPIPAKYLRDDHGRDRVLLVAIGDRAASPTRRTSAACSSATSTSRAARIHPLAELKYRYLKWKINRVRKKFDVYSGGRADDCDRRVH